MNSKQKQVRIRECVICHYPFAEEHHIYLKRSEGVMNETLLLCPNHHQFANLIQVMIENGSTLFFIKNFARERFDEEFNEVALEYLIYKFYKYFIVDLFARRGVNVEYLLAKKGKSIDGMFLEEDTSLDTLFGNRQRNFENFIGVLFKEDIFSTVFSGIHYGGSDWSFPDLISENQKSR